MKYFILTITVFSFLVAYGNERIWTLEVDESRGIVTWNQEENPDEEIQVNRNSWPTYELANKPFQCKLPDGPTFQKKDIHGFSSSFRLREQFMVPQTENGLVINWKLVNQEGYELGSIRIFLSDSPQYLRKFLFFYARSARALKAGKKWVKDKVENRGVWVMYHSDFQNDRVALVAIFGNLGISFRETGSNDQLRFDSKDVEELFQLLLGKKSMRYRAMI